MLFSMNIRRSKSLMWTLNILAIVGISLVFMMIYKKKMSGNFIPQNYKDFTADIMKGFNSNIISKNMKQDDLQKYRVLWTTTINGKKKPIETGETKPEKDTPEFEPVENILRVMLILKADDSKESCVRLEYLKEEVVDKEPFKLEIWSYEGDPLMPPYDTEPFNGKVLRIENDRVIFSYHGEETPLSTDLLVCKERNSGNRSGESLLPPRVVKKFEPPPNETTEFKPGSFHLSQKETDHITTNWESELNQVTLTSKPNRRTGKTELMVAKVSEKSLIYQRGFRTGDTLVSVNGFPIHSKAGAINYYKTHPNEGTYNVVISRNGRFITKTFKVPPKK